MSLEVTFNKDTNNPVWNDTENDRRRITRRTARHGSVRDNNFNSI